MRAITDPDARELADINFGPWDRLDNNAPFVPGVGREAGGRELLPARHDQGRVRARGGRGGAHADSLKSLYTMVRRERRAVHCTPFPTRATSPPRTQRAAAKLREAAALAEDAGLRRYLALLAHALETDDYQPSDLAWMDMKNNTLDIVIGPIETYEDELFGYKAANEAYVLIKDQAWSQRLARYAAELPALQRGLPVEPQYKRETPGHRRRPQRLRRRLLRGAGERRRQDHRHQPAERRGGAAEEGHAPPAAQERDARQVRPHPACRSPGS